MKKQGFTLIELLIVIAIMGVVAAIAIPNFMTALQKGKQKATMADIKNIGTAIESYMVEHQMAPGNGNASLVGDLVPYLSPFYVKILPQKDGWGEPLRYDSGQVGAGEELYSIISYGRDRVSTGIDVTNSNYNIVSIEDFGKDICFSNGHFSYCPKIK